MATPNSKSTREDRKRRQVAAKVKIRISQVVAPRLPHEHDESADAQSGKPSEIIRQAERDLERGLRDTDRGPQMAKVYKKL